MKRIILLLASTGLVIAMYLSMCGNKIGALVPHHSVAPAFWFEGFKTPPPSNETPFNNKLTGDTSFHLWAWQKFLSLTRTDKPRAPFEYLTQIDTNTNVLKDTLDHIMQLSDSNQAFSHFVIYDTNHSAVLYAIQVDNNMHNFQHQYIPIFKRIIKDCRNHNWRPTPAQNSLAIDSAVQDSIHLQHLDTLNFPVGALVLKTAWIRASEVKDRRDYYITNALITTRKGKHVERVVLIGMHVVGRVVNHPEFIWATFEHENLAPDYHWKQSWPQDTIHQVLSNENFLFYKKNTPISDCLDTAKNIHKFYTNLFNMFPLGEAWSFVYNTKSSPLNLPNDTLPNALDKLDYENSLLLNRSVHEHLEKIKSLWSHYFYKGSVWLNAVNTNFTPGNANIYLLTNPALNGGRALSNLVMESFTQLDYGGIYDSGSMNCFGCHSPADFKNVANPNDGLSYNAAISHIFKNAIAPPKLTAYDDRKKNPKRARLR